MATAQEMAAFAANARYIHVTDAETVVAVALRHFDIEARAKRVLKAQVQDHASHGQHIGEMSLQFRDKGNRLCWIQSRTDPLGLSHVSLRYQEDEWPPGNEPRLTEDEERFSWSRVAFNTREALAKKLHQLTHEDLANAQPPAWSEREALMRNGNNPPGTRRQVTSHVATKNPLIIGGRMVPAHPHHFTTEDLAVFLERHLYPGNTIADRLREHTQTLRDALLKGERLPERVMKSPEGQLAIDDAVLAWRAGESALHLERNRAQRTELTQALLGALTDKVDDTTRITGRRAVRAPLLWAALDAQETLKDHPTPNQTSLLYRALGRSATVFHPQIPFPMRISFVTRHSAHDDPGGPLDGGLPNRTRGYTAPIGQPPPAQSCMLVVEDARMPFGNAWATVASFSADEVDMALRDMLHDAEITPEQAACVVGQSWLMNRTRPVRVDVLESRDVQGVAAAGDEDVHHDGAHDVDQAARERMSG